MAAEVLAARVETKKWVYGYTLKTEEYEGLIKVGETNREVETRVREQVADVRLPKKPYKILFRESAMRPDGTTFSDHDLHRTLKGMGCAQVEREWYRCSVEELKAAYAAVFYRKQAEAGRTESFPMREEQRAAVEMTAAYFRRMRAADPGRAPRFLWNAKMRSVECEDAVREDLRDLSAGQGDGVQAGAGADVQAGGNERVGGGSEAPLGLFWVDVYPAARRPQDALHG